MSGRKVRAPEKTLAVVDHNIQTTDRSQGIADPESRQQVEQLAENANEFGIEYYDEFDRRQGIVHIIGPEQGFTLPGTTIVCGDSHTSTHGAFGALAHGIGTSEVEHVLATQTLIQTKAKNMRVIVDGALRRRASPPRTSSSPSSARSARRAAPAMSSNIAGEAIRALSMEGRMTVCNMSIEGGARAGMIAPDDKTYAYLKDRPKSPKGALWDQALRHWETLRQRRWRAFRRDVKLDAANLPPIVSWGTSPQDVAPIVGAVPRVDDGADRAEARLDQARARLHGPQGRGEDRRHRHRPRLHRLVHQRPHRGFARRRGDRRAATRSASASTRWSCPGSGLVKAQAEAEGLDKIFLAAGFEWREPGCSMCLAMNPDKLAPGERCASTSNRNFEGRQGYRGRTHLVSPAMAAAAAIAGRFVDVREWR